LIDACSVIPSRCIVLVHATTLTKHSVGTCWCRSLRRCLRHDDFYESHIAAIKRGQPLPFSHEKLDALCKMYSKRRVASQLGSRRCLICSAHTSYFSYIACARCCQDCFVTAPDAQLCSLEYAKVRHCSRTCIISTRALTWRSRCWCRMPIVHRVSRATLARYDHTLISLLIAALVRIGRAASSRAASAGSKGCIRTSQGRQNRSGHYIRTRTCTYLVAYIDSIMSLRVALACYNTADDGSYVWTVLL
jgi:hypothetical protein